MRWNLRACNLQKSQNELANEPGKVLLLHPVRLLNCNTSSVKRKIQEVKVRPAVEPIEPLKGLRVMIWDLWWLRPFSQHITSILIIHNAFKVHYKVFHLRRSRGVFSRQITVHVSDTVHHYYTVITEQLHVADQMLRLTRFHINRNHSFAKLYRCAQLLRRIEGNPFWSQIPQKPLSFKPLANRLQLHMHNDCSDFFWQQLITLVGRVLDARRGPATCPRRQFILDFHANCFLSV